MVNWCSLVHAVKLQGFAQRMKLSGSCSVVHHVPALGVKILNLDPNTNGACEQAPSPALWSSRGLFLLGPGYGGFFSGGRPVCQGLLQDFDSVGAGVLPQRLQGLWRMFQLDQFHTKPIPVAPS